MKLPFKKLLRPIWHRFMTPPLGPRRVLVTGAAGTIGRPACAELVRHGHFVRGMDLAGTPPGSPTHEWITGSVTDDAILDTAMTDIDTVVHLAGRLEDSAFDPDMIDSNIRGIYTVFEAASRRRIQRMIYAASCSAVFWHAIGPNVPVPIGASPAPMDIYAITKLFGEHLSYLYGNHRGLPTIAIRFGWLPRNDALRNKLANSPDFHDWYLSEGDAGRGVALAVEAPAWRVGKYALLYITSKPKAPEPFDLRPAKRVLGYVPLDTYRKE